MRLRRLFSTVRLVSAPPHPDPETSQSSSQGIHEIVSSNRNVRRRTSHSPSTPRNRSSLDTPTKTTLRDEVVQRDSAMSHLRGQLLQAQNTAAMDLLAQRSSFVAAAQQYERESRHIGYVEVEEATADMRTDNERRIAMLRNLEMRQWEHTQNEMLQLQREAAEAEERAIRETEANERMCIVQSEMQDAALQAAFYRERAVPITAPASITPDYDGKLSRSVLNNSKDSNFQCQPCIEPSFNMNPTSVPVPMSVSPGITPNDFMSPLEERPDSFQTMVPSYAVTGDTSVSATNNVIFQNSPDVERKPHVLCVNWFERNKCEAGIKCPNAHSLVTGDTSVSAVPMVTAPRGGSVRRELSWDDNVSYASGRTSDALVSATKQHDAAIIYSSPSPIQQELDLLRAQLLVKDNELSSKNEELLLKMMNYQLKITNCTMHKRNC